jgi:hypothetical protein
MSSRPLGHRFNLTTATMRRRLTRAWSEANGGFAMLGLLWIVFWPFVFIAVAFTKPPEWW